MGKKRGAAGGRKRRGGEEGRERGSGEGGGEKGRRGEGGGGRPDDARRIVRRNAECIASFADNELVGRVRLGLPDDYADRYLPEILARFSRSKIAFPIRSSSRFICMDTADCVLCTISAARVNEPVSAMATKVRSWSMSRRCMGVP